MISSLWFLVYQEAFLEKGRAVFQWLVRPLLYSLTCKIAFRWIDFQENQANVPHFDAILTDTRVGVRTISCATAKAKWHRLVNVIQSRCRS